MPDTPLVSIIINNYNYDRFLAEAIDSALGQGYARTEVIVVDDGSTDRSREVIAAYGDRIIPLLKSNGGQTSTFNAGFAASQGDIICFLDADDLLLPTAVERASDLLADPGVAKCHWPLRVIKRDGRRTGALKPPGRVPQGDLREMVRRHGPDNPTWPPTSGNAWSRWYLMRVFPLPEMERVCGVRSASADAYLSMLAPLHGCVAAIQEPQGCYRIHGQNDHSCMDFDERLQRDLRLFDYRSSILCAHCREIGFEVDPELWKQNSWLHWLGDAVEQIAARIPAEDTFILVDDGAWGMQPTPSRQFVPFLERGGQYWGPPPDDATAIQELERLRQAGAGYMVFGWPAFWWLEYYSGLLQHLRSRYRCIQEDSRLVLFDLQERREAL